MSRGTRRSIIPEVRDTFVTRTLPTTEPCPFTSSPVIERPPWHEKIMYLHDTHTPVDIYILSVEDMRSIDVLVQEVTVGFSGDC